MDDGFLAEQLKRIRQMSEQMSEAQRRLGESSAYKPGEPEDPVDAFHAIRDYRPFDTHDYHAKTAPLRRRTTTADPRPVAGKPPRRHRRR